MQNQTQVNRGHTPICEANAALVHEANYESIELKTCFLNNITEGQYLESRTDEMYSLAIQHLNYASESDLSASVSSSANDVIVSVTMSLIDRRF